MVAYTTFHYILESNGMFYRENSVSRKLCRRQHIFLFGRRFLTSTSYKWILILPYDDT